ncbi:CHASE2 domain-containing protein [Qipengyuania flava]|uniref:CHASE2 domain-containing protein n=1 Tax=Qipengyuania flava TaxID=192812 RepID=UPI001C63071C|nr:CHASE2 domain-containing protein [Qipengyuania flava]QYJ07597.1 CHASE2 domain-containing protein [Qipengyuania flava]
MNRLVTRQSRLRKPSRRELALFALLAAFIAVIEPFEPYDWLQSSVTAAINAKDYEGNAIIVAIDEETERNLPSRSWTRSELAALLTKLGQSEPEVILVDQQYFQDEDSSSLAELSAALEALPERPYWHVELSPEAAGSLSESAPAMDADSFVDSSAALDPALANRVRPAVATMRSYAFGAPIFVPLAVEQDGGPVPSFATILAGGTRGAERNVINVDLSYRPGTIPSVSAAEVLAEDFDTSVFENRPVIVSFTSTLGRDTRDTPNDTYTEKAAVWVMAAETLIRGPPRVLGWVPTFLIAVLAGLAWMYLPRPYGRIVAGVAFVGIALSPIVFEQHLIFVQTSHGLFLLLILAIAKLWQRGQGAVRTYRSAAETKSRFLAQASHDLRQPIHAIGLLAERLSQTDLSDDQAKLVSKISWSVDNASRMFRALLDIAAIESGTLQTDIRPVAMNELLAGIDSQNALSAEQANVDLRLVPCDLMVRTDPALIGTMIQNLVSNAIKYSPGKGVLVGCRMKAGRLAIYVVDNGRGISSSDMEHVKKEFFRSSRKSTLSSENKGLGLAIVNRLADMLHVKLTLRSEEGRGTVATIEGLEVVEQEDAKAAANADRPLPLSGLRVALADDDEETLASTRGLLEQWGCTVQTFAQLPEDLPDCDILLSDYDFGGGSTLAGRHDLVLQAEETGTQIIIISGHHPAQIRETIASHSGLILAKPLRAAELRSALMAARQG